MATSVVLRVSPSLLEQYLTGSAKIAGVIILEVFDENEVALFEGDVSVATALLDLPFNHIFFTGSTRVGKIVMAAAAKHLSSVTLELGGKSPVIIDEGADIEKIGLEKTEGLLACGGDVTLLAPTAVPELERLADEGSIAWERRTYAGVEDLDATFMVIACTDDTDVNIKVYEDAEAAQPAGT